MKSLADLRRAIKVGTTVTLVASNKSHKYLNVPRKVVLVNTVGFALLPDTTDTGASPSYLSWPKARELRFAHDDEFTVTLSYVTLTYEVKK